MVLISSSYSRIYSTNESKLILVKTLRNEVEYSYHDRHQKVSGSDRFS